MPEGGSHLNLEGHVEPISPWQRGLRVLVLSGGGFRGVFTSRVLSRIEEACRSPTKELFDVIIGTSTGALIGAAVCAGKTAADVERTYDEIGPSVFSLGPHRLQGTRFESVAVLSRRLFLSEPYLTRRLRLAIQTVLGKEVSEAPISGFSSKFVAVAVSYTHAQIVLFGAKALGLQDDIRLEDAILASAAAPTFFPPISLGEEIFIDGGLVANSPELVAIRLARAAGHRLRDVRILSVGTGSPDQSAAAERNRRRSAIEWLFSSRGLVQLTMAAQEHLASSFAAELLGEDYAKIDLAPNSLQADAIGQMDNATQSASNTLKLMADSAWKAFQARDGIGRFVRR